MVYGNNRYGRLNPVNEASSNSDIISVIKSLPKMQSTGAATATQLAASEKELGVRFSDEYKKYLLAYGKADAYNTELTGICKDKNTNVVDATKREWGVCPAAKKQKLYVVENLGIEGVIIWQDQTGNIYETWDGNREPKKIYSSLVEYLTKDKSQQLTEAADDKKEYTVVPLKSVNGVPFGADRDDVRKAFGKATEFQKTKFSKSKTDNFGSCHCFYDADDKLEAVEIFYGSDIKMNGKYVPWNIDGAKEIISDLKMVKETKNDNRHYMSKKYQCGMETDAEDNGNIHSILFAGKNYYNESALVTEADDSEVKSIKNPFGSGAIKDYKNSSWTALVKDTVFAKEYAVRYSIVDYGKDGLNESQRKSCEYFMKNKNKIYRELEDRLYDYANKEADNGSSGRFFTQQQLQRLFTPYAIDFSEDGKIVMWMNNVFEWENGLCAKLYPGKVEVYAE